MRSSRRRSEEEEKWWWVNIAWQLTRESNTCPLVFLFIFPSSSSNDDVEGEREFASMLEKLSAQIDKLKEANVYFQRQSEERESRTFYLVISSFPILYSPALLQSLFSDMFDHVYDVVHTKNQVLQEELNHLQKENWLLNMKVRREREKFEEVQKEMSALESQLEVESERYRLFE